MAEKKTETAKESGKALGTRGSGDGAGAAIRSGAENYAGAIHSPRADENTGGGVCQWHTSTADRAEGENPGETQRSGLTGEDLVTYTAPLDPKSEQQDIIVGVNGELIRIKRGETVQIKRKFLEVLQHAAAQELAAHRTMDKAAKGA